MKHKKKILKYWKNKYNWQRSKIYQFVFFEQMKRKETIWFGIILLFWICCEYFFFLLDLGKCCQAYNFRLKILKMDRKTVKQSETKALNKVNKMYEAKIWKQQILRHTKRYAPEFWNSCEVMLNVFLQTPLIFHKNKLRVFFLLRKSQKAKSREQLAVRQQSIVLYTVLRFLIVIKLNLIWNTWVSSRNSQK